MAARPRGFEDDVSWLTSPGAPPSPPGVRETWGSRFHRWIFFTGSLGLCLSAVLQCLVVVPDKSCLSGCYRPMGLRVSNPAGHQGMSPYALCVLLLGSARGCGGGTCSLALGRQGENDLT